MKISSLLLLAVAGLFSLAAQAQVSVGSNEITGYYDSTYATRINPTMRLSGDGTRMVYVVKENTTFDTSLSGWLSGRSGGWSSGDATRLYLYDTVSKTSTLLYQGQFATTTASGTPVLQSLEHGFSADINRDGSKVVLAYTLTVASAKRDSFTNTLKIAVIDTDSKAMTQITSVGVPGTMAVSAPLRMSDDGSMAVFAYEVPATTNANVWGVSYPDTTSTVRLVAVRLSAGAQPVQLNASNSGKYASSSELINFIDAKYAGFFDISADGKKVVFQYSGSGKVMGIASDGTGSSEIAALTPGYGAYVAISGDGSTVAYADRASKYAVLYAKPFSGGTASEITRSNTYYAGNLKLNSNGSLLLYSDYQAGPGGAFGYSGTSWLVASAAGSTPVKVKSDLLDASEDFTRVLSGTWNSPVIYLSQIAAPLSSFDMSSSILNIPRVEVSGNAYAVRLRLLGSDLRLRLIAVDNALISTDANTATVDAAFNVTVPAVLISGASYALRLRLVDSGTLTFQVESVK